MGVKREKVLFIANYYPPMGGPGVTRSLRFTQHLHKFGFDPIVLTLDEESIRTGPFKWDESLMKEVPEDVRVLRTPIGKPGLITRLLSRMRLYRLAWFFNFSKNFDTSARWPEAGMEEAEKALKTHDIRLIYTSSGPFSALLFGYRLKKRNPHLKWVADLRDPWTDGYMWKWPGKWQWNWSRRKEKLWLNAADKVIVNTPAVLAHYKERELLPPEKMEVITNGF